MKKAKQLIRNYQGSSSFIIVASIVIVASCTLSTSAIAQNYHTINPEAATCQVNLTVKEVVATKSNLKGSAKTNKTKQVEKSFKPALNQQGHFNQVSNIQPLQTVLVKMSYPNAASGDKVLVAAADGGFMDDNKKVIVVQLDDKKNFSFDFHAGKDAGIYRVIVKKGNDTKVVQLWVGPDLQPVKN